MSEYLQLLNNFDTKDFEKNIHIRNLSAIKKYGSALKGNYTEIIKYIQDQEKLSEFQCYEIIDFLCRTYNIKSSEQIINLIKTENILTPSSEKITILMPVQKRSLDEPLDYTRVELNE